MKKLLLFLISISFLTAIGANAVIFEHRDTLTIVGDVNSRYVRWRSEEFPAEPNTWYRATAEIRTMMDDSPNKTLFRVRNVKPDGKSIVYAIIADLRAGKLDFTTYSNVFMTRPECARLQVYFILNRIKGQAQIRNIKIEKLSTAEAEKIMESKRVAPAFFYEPVCAYAGEKTLEYGYRVSADFIDKTKMPVRIEFSLPAYNVKSATEVKINSHEKVLCNLDSPLKVGKYDVLMQAFDKNNKVVAEEKSILKVIPKPHFSKRLPVKSVSIDSEGFIVVNGKRRIINGIYHAHYAEPAKHIAKIGINAAQSWAPTPETYKKVMEIMEANDIYANCVLKNIKGKQLDDLVKAIKNAPALFSWDIVDEPAIRNIKPEHLAACTTQLRNYKTLRPLRISFSDPTAVKPYQQHYDIAAVHKYVLPYDGLAKQGVTVRHIIKNILPGQAPHITLQSWVHWHDETQSPQSAVQTRSQGYLALINGATGVWWYHYPTAYAIPQIWGALKQFGAELNELEPFFTGKRIPLKSSTPNVEAAQFINGEKSIVVAVNTGMNAETVTFSEIKGKKLSELFADKAKYSTSEKIVIPPQDTRIFECL